MDESQTCVWGLRGILVERTQNGQKQREIEDQLFYTSEHTKDQTARSESSLGERSSCKSRKRKSSGQK